MHRADGVEEVEEEEIERGSLSEDHGRAERVRRAPLVFLLLHELVDDSAGDRLVGRRGERLHLLRAGVCLCAWIPWHRGVSSPALHVNVAHRRVQLDAKQVRANDRAANARRHFGGRHRLRAASPAHEDL